MQHENLLSRSLSLYSFPYQYVRLFENVSNLKSEKKSKNSDTGCFFLVDTPFWYPEFPSIQLWLLSFLLIERTLRDIHLVTVESEKLPTGYIQDSQAFHSLPSDLFSLLLYSIFVILWNLSQLLTLTDAIADNKSSFFTDQGAHEIWIERDVFLSGFLE